MDDDVTAAVRAFRAATTTTRADADRRRIWRSIEVQTRRESSRMPLVVGAAVLAIAAALVLVLGGLRGDDAVREDASPGADQAIDAADRATQQGTVESLDVVPAELDASALPREAAPAPTPATVPATKSSARPVEVPANLEEPRPEMGSDTITTAPERLKREAALLLRARQAALKKDRAAARAALDAHALQFPRGELAPERWTLSIELACAAGERDVAARAAISFANAYPDVASAKALRDRPCDSMTNQAASGQSSAGAR